VSSSSPDLDQKTDPDYWLAADANQALFVEKTPLEFSAWVHHTPDGLERQVQMPAVLYHMGQD
jgi:hypothetical protein